MYMYSRRNKKIIIKKSQDEKKGIFSGEGKKNTTYNAFIHTHYAVHYYNILYTTLDRAPQKKRFVKTFTV